MTPIFAPYKAEHFAQIAAPSQDSIKFAVEAERSAFAYSVLDDAGRCIGCAGILRTQGRCWYMWAVVDETLRENRLWFHRMVRRYLPLWLANVDWIRVEAQVEADSERNCRWVEALGFEFESRRRCAGENGGDTLIYARVK